MVARLDSGHVLSDEDVDVARLIEDLDEALGRPTDSIVLQVAGTPLKLVEEVIGAQPEGLRPTEVPAEQGSKTLLSKDSGRSHWTTRIKKSPRFESASEWLAALGGARIEILRLVPTARPAYTTYGLVILSTSALVGTTFAAALTTVRVASPLACWLMGALWALMILVLDRFQGMVEVGSVRGWRVLVAILPRLILALVTGVLIVQPLMLAVLRPEILAILSGSGGIDHVGDAGIFLQLRALDTLVQGNSAIYAAVILVNLMFVILSLLPVIVRLASWNLSEAYSLAVALDKEADYKKARVNQELKYVRAETYLDLELGRLDAERRTAVAADSLLVSAVDEINKSAIDAWKSRVGDRLVHEAGNWSAAFFAGTETPNRLPPIPRPLLVTLDDLRSPGR